MKLVKSNDVELSRWFVKTDYQKATIQYRIILSLQAPILDFNSFLYEYNQYICQVIHIKKKKNSFRIRKNYIIISY